MIPILVYITIWLNLLRADVLSNINFLIICIPKEFYVFSHINSLHIS